MRAALTCAAFLALTVAACTLPPMATPEVEAAGKQFSPPQGDLAALYVFRRAGLYGIAVPVTINIGQRRLGVLSAHTWYRVDLPAGRYDVRCIAPEVSASMDVPLKPGETKFVETGIRLGFVGARCNLEEIAAAEGRKAVIVGHRAQEVAP